MTVKNLLRMALTIRNKTTDDCSRFEPAFRFVQKIRTTKELSQQSSVDRTGIRETFNSSIICCTQQPKSFIHRICLFQVVSARQPLTPLQPQLSTVSPLIAMPVLFSITFTACSIQFRAFALSADAFRERRIVQIVRSHLENLAKDNTFLSRLICKIVQMATRSVLSYRYLKMHTSSIVYSTTSCLSVNAERGLYR